jgi:CheY-like chemotaxis protein
MDTALPDLYTLGDLGKFQQVIMNLISNAKDATKDQESRKIKIDLKKDHQNIATLIVSDNGSGIPENIQSKIFDSFFTTKKSGEGTGIGLDIVKKVIQNMDGEITVESEMNVGTSFKVTVPLVEKQSLPHIDKSEEDRLKLKGRALLVDDEEGIRSLLMDLLEDLGLNVEEAESGQMALKMVDENKYDYIFSDVQMPKMSGPEFIEKARQLPNGKAKYFIITGGITSHLTNNLEGLISGIIKKPFDEDEIYNSLTSKKC